MVFIEFEFYSHKILLERVFWSAARAPSYSGIDWRQVTAGKDRLWERK